MNDPYKVLGVSRDATDDEIKAAYRELAKKYHPDSYADNPLADLVEEKMKEINEAYDAIRKERAGGGRTGSSSGGYGGYGGNTSGGTTSFANVRQLISQGRYSEAELVLDSVSSNNRSAEWHYLKGCVLLQRGAVYDAARSIDTACYMDPSNEEYRNARESIRHYSSGGRMYRQGGSSDEMCNLCSSLLCADCLCECCGGDLIPCC